LPDHAPEAAQLVALVEDQLSVALLPLWIALGPTLKVTVGAALAGVTVTVVDWLAWPPGPVQVSVYVLLVVRLGVTNEPLSACVRAHAPEAVQAVALLEVQLNVELLPLAIVLGRAPKLTVGIAGVTAINVDCVALPPGPAQVRE
jgi:hypothetical protein